MTDLYAARLVRMRDARWAIIGFVNEPGGGPFVGSLGDPVPVETIADFPR